MTDFLKPWRGNRSRMLNRSCEESFFMRGVYSSCLQQGSFVLHVKNDFRRVQIPHPSERLTLTDVHNPCVAMNIRRMRASQLFVTGLFALAIIKPDTAVAAPHPSREAMESPLLPADLRQVGTYVGERGSHSRQTVQHPAGPFLGRPERSTDSLPRGRRGRHRHVIDTTASAGHGAQKMAMCPKAGRMISMSAAGEPKGWFVFHIHVHDDVPQHMARNVAQRFDWWLDEMRDLLPQGMGLHLRIVRGEKGLSDLDYAAVEGEDPEKGLKALKAVLTRRGPCDTGLPMPRNYHLLLTAKQPYPGMRGLASPGARAGIASMSSPRTAGHELGHMLRATHEQGAVERIDGSQRCATAMREDSGWPRYPDCGRFSKTNREKMGSHLADIWKTARSKAPA
jgi:hypothetical protein